MKAWRLWILIAIIFLSYLALAANIYNLQIEKGQYYSARAASQTRGYDFTRYQRGTIYFEDRNGNPIPAALNREYPVIYAVPKEIADPEDAARLLSPVLKIDAKKIQSLLSKPNDLYELLLNKANAEQVDKVKALAIKGLYIDSQYFRFYPFSSLAAHLLGFVGLTEENDSYAGRYGIELYSEKDLKKGDAHLTVDRNIQSQAEKTLQSLIEKFKAKGGTVIVQDPKTGKILAMGSYPNFDPNNYAQSPIKNFLNPAVQAVYEPGSIFKIFTMAAGLDSGKITADTKFYDPGSLTLNGKTITNWDKKAHGTVTMTQVIEQSINTGAAFAERKTGHDIFYNYLSKFGFEDITGIDLPGEIKGTLKNIRGSARDINFATVAFGQGVSVTPLQLVSAVSAIANDGVLMQPFIFESEKPHEVRRVIGKDTADAVTKMMVSAVQKAEIAQISGYEIAGKTGTAQIPDFRHGGYSDNYIHSYAGFAPASNPRFTILIKLDRPQGAPLAGITVVPAFRELAQFIINYYNIPADNLNTSH